MTTARGCEHCGQALPVLSRADRRYCGSRCRTAAHRANRRPPAELTDRARWVRHSKSKVPLTTAGAAASSTDSSTWATYAHVSRSAVGAGLGCVLTRGDDVVCIDLDHALDERGRALPWAAEILARAPRTWIEVSPSGDGLHVWGRAEMTGGRRLRRPEGHVEIYADGRYITVTGRPFAGAASNELGDLSDLIASLVRAT